MLMIAAKFKVVEVCGLLVSIIVSDMQRTHDQLLLKRIDFNLMQTQIALTSMKEQEMSSPLILEGELAQAACVHRQIMAMTEGSTQSICGLAAESISILCRPFTRFMALDSALTRSDSTCADHRNYMDTSGLRRNAVDAMRNVSTPLT